MSYRLTTLKIATVSVAAAVALSACSSSGTPATNSSSSSMSSSMSMSSAAPATSSSSSAAAFVNGATTPAATLRAGLDTLLRQHVDLTGFVVYTAVHTSLTSPQTTAAVKALDDNTVALGTAIGAAYGAAAKTQFISIWRAHIGFFVNYTKGLATGDKAMVAKAQSDLAGYRATFAKFINGATGLSAAAVSADLQGHVQTLEAAISAIVNKSSDAASKLQDAAMHMDGTAAVLAAGIASNKKLAGNANGAGSTLRAALTGLLIQHVAQTVAVVQTAVATSLTSAQTTAAVKALDDNTVALGTAIGSVYGASAKTAFISMWRAHIGFFVNYTKGLATNDSKLVATAQSQLAGYRASFSKFLGSATGLPAAAISADLQGHVQTLETAIKAIATNSSAAAADVSMAEAHMAGTAAVLATGIAAQKKLS